MIKRKISVWLPIFFSLAVIIGMLVGYRMRDAMPGKSFFYRERAGTLQEIVNLLNNKYVDSIDVAALSDTAIQSILEKLDPHSVFIPSNELAEANEEIRGSFFGIGIEFNVFDDSLHVINVIQGGPADKAGLKTGDIILSAGDSAIAGRKIDSDRVRNLLRGEEGSIVKVKFLRGAQSKFTEVKRGIIPVTSVDASYLLDASTGYLRLNKFSSKTYREFMIALTDLKKQGMKDLVLDLRANGGGVLDEAVEIADEFLSGDKLITYTQGLHSEKKEYRCRREGQFETGKLIVLADEGTASASEILLGALQDWDRATIIGRRSFGKGLVQEQFDLADGSAVRITIARYFTPLGRSIQRSYAKGGAAYYEEVAHRFSQLQSADSIKNDSTKSYKSAGGKKLYGGGGISPDVYVPSDTSAAGPVSAQIYTRGTLNDFGYRYFKDHRSALGNYKNAGAFIRNFKVTESDWQYFSAFAKQDSIDLSTISLKERAFISGVLKSFIARQLYRTEGFFEAMNTDDVYIKKALEFLK